MTAIPLDLSQLISAGTKSAQAMAASRAAITARRRQAMVAGTRVGAMPVHTDDTAQTRVLGAALAATRDPDYTLTWKLADDSFSELTAVQILAVAQAIRNHVQACYDREAALLAALAVGRAEDIDAGWPG